MMEEQNITETKNIWVIFSYTYCLDVFGQVTLLFIFSSTSQVTELMKQIVTPLNTLFISLRQNVELF